MQGVLSLPRESCSVSCILQSYSQRPSLKYRSSKHTMDMSKVSFHLSMKGYLLPCNVKGKARTLKGCLGTGKVAGCYSEGSLYTCFLGRCHQIQIGVDGLELRGIPLWTKKYMINLETFSTCNQHVNCTFTNSQEFHACTSYMPTHMLWNDTHVRAVKK